MLESLPGTATSKIDLVRRAAHDTLRVASPRAQSGLMTFRSDDRDRPVIEAPIPLLANGMREGGQTHGERLAEAVDDLEVRGGTPLYNAVRDAYGLAVRSYQPDMVNQIVLLSDGRNEDARGSIGLGRLVRELEASLDPERPVRIIAIGYGPDADMAALRRIVGVTAGRASWLRDVDDYTGAVQEALFEL
jgi:Ca-activated chloride channel family protein